MNGWDKGVCLTNENKHPKGMSADNFPKGNCLDTLVPRGDSPPSTSVPFT